MKKHEAARIAEETVEIVNRGSYETTGGTVDISALVETAVRGTVNYPPNEPVPDADEREPRETRFEVNNETTLEAARRLATDDVVPAALNFASANKPGGGFRNGARAQEESLARSSALYACIHEQPMYAYHREQHDPMYSRWVIHSPAVPVIRDDHGHLLGEPYRCAFLTSPAVNAGVVLERDPSRTAEIEDAMRDRIDRVLRVADYHHHDVLVLGAWGCGVFRNDPQMVARLFHEELVADGGRFRGRFAHVVFAVLDHTKHERIITPFRDRFAPEA